MNDWESDIDRLYRLPPSEFVGARDALARRLRAAGRHEDAARARSLPKPTIVAWAANQAYWRAPLAFRELLGAAEMLRTAQARGTRALQDARSRHRDALQSLVDVARRALVEAGQPPNAATERKLTLTLEALAASPGDGEDRPGRLPKELLPGGFDPLADATDLERKVIPLHSQASARELPDPLSRLRAARERAEQGAAATPSPQARAPAAKGDPFARIAEARRSLAGGANSKPPLGPEGGSSRGEPAATSESPAPPPAPAAPADPVAVREREAAEALAALFEARARAAEAEAALEEAREALRKTEERAEAAVAELARAKASPKD